MKFPIALALSLFLSGCGYSLGDRDKIAVSVPYTIGDFEGELTDAIIQELSETAQFRYTTGTADWILKTKVVGTNNDRIGYRYDRKVKSIKGLPDEDCEFEEERRINVVGIENRETITVEVSVIKEATGETILGPLKVKADSDYDYTNPNSLTDLSFFDPVTGTQSSSIAFSLGQLDYFAAAQEDALYPTYKRLAQKIIDGMIASTDE